MRHYLFLLIIALCSVSVTGQTAPPWQTGTYVYDGAGNIKSVGTEQYRYDRYGRLQTGTVAPGRTQSATYDAFGNILTLTTDGTTITMGVDPDTNRLTQSASVHGSYDLAGRLTQGPDYSFDYDALDAVMKSTVNGDTKVHVYTAGNERILSVTVSNGFEEWTLRDPSAKVLRRIEKRDSGWNWKQDYIYRGNALLASEIDGVAQTLHFFPDHLGSPRLITGNGGYTVAFHTYFPFGEEATSHTQDVEKLKFTSHERDALGLDYMHARYFVPTWGRFLSVDPTWESADLGKPQSWNRYSYVWNNPVNATDPDGRLGFLTNDPEVLRQRHDKIIGYATKFVADFVLPDGQSDNGTGADKPDLANAARAGAVITVGRKLDFLFDKNVDQSNEKNAARARGNAKAMRTAGIADTAANREVLVQRMSAAVSDSSTVIAQSGDRATHQIVVPGKTSGRGVIIEFIVEKGSKLITLIGKTAR